MSAAMDQEIAVAEIQPLPRTGEVVFKPNHTPVLANIHGGTFVFHCPDDIHENGKHSRMYKSWYRSEYQRHTYVLSRQGNFRAVRSCAKHAATKNEWQKRTRREKRLRDSQVANDLRNYFLSSNEAGLMGNIENVD